MCVMCNNNAHVSDIVPVKGCTKDVPMLTKQEGEKSLPQTLDWKD